MVSPELAAHVTEARVAIVRTVLVIVLLVAVYFVVPVDGEFDVSAAFVLIGCLIAFVLLLGIQIWQITQSPHPRLRALQTLATSVTVFLLIFAEVYLILERGNAGAFNEPLTNTDSLYFTITVFSTVGFGDITAQTQAARVVVMVQMLGDLVLVGIIVKVLLGAMNAGLRRRENVDADRDGL